MRMQMRMQERTGIARDFPLRPIRRSQFTGSAQLPKKKQRFALDIPLAGAREQPRQPRLRQPRQRRQAALARQPQAAARQPSRAQDRPRPRAETQQFAAPKFNFLVAICGNLFFFFFFALLVERFILFFPTFGFHYFPHPSPPFCIFIK
jgi:hypothetical protein